jgi:hypothetical protein
MCLEILLFNCETNKNIAHKVGQNKQLTKLIIGIGCFQFKKEGKRTPNKKIKTNS